MTTTTGAWSHALAAILTIGLFAAATGQAQQRQTGRGGYTPPRTPWGHPDIEGVYTNKDEANIPLERPDALKGRAIEEFTASDLAALAKERQALAAKIAGGIGGAETGAGPTHWYEHLQGYGSRPWMIVDPADGKIPAFTPQAAKREAAFAALNNARNGEGRADSWTDRSLYDRCVTRGLPGSMMPAIYGNAYEIVQTPTSVAIRYEMIHETRVIPLDPSTSLVPRQARDDPEQSRGVGAGGHRLSPKTRLYLGDARGRWDGTTLVVETTNFTDRTHMGYNNRYNSEQYRLIERFTPAGPGALTWEVTIDDPGTFVRPWTFAMQLTRDDTQVVYEYACHEGNRGLEHILSAARAEEGAR